MHSKNNIKKGYGEIKWKSREHAATETTACSAGWGFCLKKLKIQKGSRQEEKKRKWKQLSHHYCTFHSKSWPTYCRETQRRAQISHRVDGKQSWETNRSVTFNLLPSNMFPWPPGRLCPPPSPSGQSSSPPLPLPVRLPSIFISLSKCATVSGTCLTWLELISGRIIYGSHE